MEDLFKIWKDSASRLPLILALLTLATTAVAILYFYTN